MISVVSLQLKIERFSVSMLQYINDKAFIPLKSQTLLDIAHFLYEIN